MMHSAMNWGMSGSSAGITGFPRRRLGMILCLALIGTSPAFASNGSGSVAGKGGEPISGVKFNILSAGTSKTPTVTAPTDDNGKTTFDTNNIAPGVYNVWYCPDGKTIYVVPLDKKAEPPCPDPDAVWIGTVPVTPNAPFLAVDISQPNVTSWVNGVTPVNADSGSVYPPGSPSYTIRPDPNNPQTYTVTVTDSYGIIYYLTGVPASEIGKPFSELVELHGGANFIDSNPNNVPNADPGKTVENKQPDGQGIGANPSEKKQGASIPVNSPAEWANAILQRSIARFYNPFAPKTYVGSLAPLNLLGMLAPFARSPQANELGKQRASYMLVATGNSSGEVFSAVVDDPSGRTETVPITVGMALEPTGRKLAGSLPPKSPKQALNGYCLDFHKEPPAAGALYRIAGPEKQEAYAPIRYIFAAVDQLKAQGKLHPDTAFDEYLDAIRQYAVWTHKEHWNEEQFTQSWIQRTQKNAEYMKVKWTKQMEKTLRQARAALAERAKEQVLALAKRGGPWKQ